MLCEQETIICIHWKDLSYILRQVREEATGRVYKVFNEKEDANEEEVSWCSTIILGRYQREIWYNKKIILGRVALILGIAASAVAGIVLLAAGKEE